MISQTLSVDGSSDWSKVDWSNRDIGEYTNLCPDQQYANFEYGSLCIVDWVRLVAERPLRVLPPSKVMVKLRQLEKALDRLPLQASARLYDNKRMIDPVLVMKSLVEREIASVGGGHLDEDHARSDLAEDAWSIWAAHHGKIRDTKFADYIDRLIINSGFAADDRPKNRMSTDTLVRDIRNLSKGRAPKAWNLWGS